MIDREIMDALVLASAQLQDANRICRAKGREDLCRLLTDAAWKLAEAISELVPDSAAAAS